MKVFYSLDNLPTFASPVVSVGSFDGVHCGHRALLMRVGQIAKERSGESVVVTFSPHPRQILPRGGELKLLNTLEEKIFLLDEAGIDNLVVLPFDEEFARLSYSDFIKSLVDKIGMKYLVIGYDHRFGRDKEGEYSSLEEMGPRLGFTVEQISRQTAGQHRVSSTEVRNAIMVGDMSLASELISRGYIMIADIDEGRVKVHEAVKLLPPPGSYEVTVGRGKDVPKGTDTGRVADDDAYPAVLEIDHEQTMRLERRQSGKSSELNDLSKADTPGKTVESGKNVLITFDV